jgi:phenylpropionate dioxygenase-like ring-hydroxylating dioxygenase large terminal subunit
VTTYPEAIRQSWLPVAAVREIGRRPLACQLHGVPVVVFRSGDAIAAMKDRCPHRNVPLSDGRVSEGAIVCPYHGWAFGADGACRAVPGATEIPKVSAEALPVRVEAGLVFTNLGDKPRDFPAVPATLNDDGFDHFIWPVTSQAILSEAIENLLDAAHPHYVHAGLVRSASRRNRVVVDIRSQASSIEAVYHEDRRANALIPRLIEGKRLTGIGRFLPPTTAQLVYEGEAGPKFVLTAFFSPLSDDQVRVFACFSTRRGFLPAAAKEVVLRALNWPVLHQDRWILRRQRETVDAFGGPRYVQGPLDFLKLGIVRLMQGQELETDERRAECFL